MDFNTLGAATYWIVIVLWMVIVAVLFVRLGQGKRRLRGPLAVLVTVLVIDAGRTLAENLYFGTFWSAQFGWLPPTLQPYLAHPAGVAAIKLLNVVAACIVLFVLLRHWLPEAEREREAIAERLRQQERELLRLATLVNGAVTPVAVIDCKDNRLPVLMANKAFESMLGDTGSALRDLAFPADEVATTALVAAAHTKSEASVSGRSRTRGGQDVWLRVVCSRSAVNNGTHCIVTCWDDSTAHETERRLGEARRLAALGQLAGGVAHDLNNMLFVISGGTDHLRAALPAENDEAHSVLERIGQATTRGTELVRRLLGLARLTPEQPVRADAVQLITELLPLARAACGRTIEIGMDARIEAAPILVDRGAFTDAMLNLCLNARDAMNGRGRLDFALWPEARSVPGVAIALTDTGPGVPADLADRIFEPFFTTKAPEQGSGLGLPGVRAFTTAAGGDIELDRGHRRGARFIVWLPLAETATAADRPAKD